MQLQDFLERSADRGEKKFPASREFGIGGGGPGRRRRRSRREAPSQNIVARSRVGRAKLSGKADHDLVGGLIVDRRNVGSDDQLDLAFISRKEANRDERSSWRRQFRR